MYLKKLKKSYDSLAKQGYTWTESDVLESECRNRYSEIINLIEAKILPNSKSDKFFYATVNKDLGYFHNMIGNFNKSIKYLQKAKYLFLKLNDRKGLIETYNLLGDYYRDLGIKNKAIINFNNAIKKCGTIKKYLELKGQCYWGIGDIYRLTGDFGKALENLTKAEKIYIQIKSNEGISDVIWTKGYVCLPMLKFVEAEKAFKRMLEMHHNGLLDETHRDAAFGGLGDLYRLNGRCEEAIKLFEMVERSLEIQEDDGERSWIMSSMALTHLQMNDLRAAKRASILSEKLAMKINDTIALIWALQSKAEVMRLLGDNKSSEELYRQFGEKAKSYDFKNELGNSYLGLAILNKDNLKKFNNYIEQALSIYKKINSRIGIRECKKRMSYLAIKDKNIIDEPFNFA